MTLLRRLSFLLLILCSPALHAQWENTGGPPSRVIQCFTVTDSTVLAGTDGGLVRSTNSGGSWTNVGGGLPYSTVRALATVASYPFNLIAATNSGRISQSPDYGTTFTGFPVDSVQMPTLAYANAILERSPEFWVGTERGVFLLPQFYPLGSWIPINSGLPSGEFTAVRAMLGRGGDIFAGTTSGVFKLSGFTWVDKSTGLVNTNVAALGSVGTLLIAGTRQGTGEGVYISSDSGANWTLSAPITAITSILTVGSTIFVGSFGDGVWRSTNGGAAWSQVNDGFAGAAYYVMSLSANDAYIFAGTNNANVWRRPVSQLATGVDRDAKLEPQGFLLEQNFPNPFNPSTKITYRIRSQSHVTIKVFDLLGREVATLVNEIEGPGVKTATFEGGQLPSGVYVYRLQAGTFSATRKFVLMR